MMKNAAVSDPLATAEAWAAAGRAVAVATVVETWGSAPRPAGSHLVVDGDGHFEGSVSGGCVEGEVISEALDVIAGAQSRMLEFRVADETAWRAGLSCGGRIRIHIEKISLSDAAFPARIVAARSARKAAVRFVDLADGKDEIVIEGEVSDAVFAASMHRALQSGKPAHAQAEGKSYFSTVYLPLPRLVLIGAVHISQALAPMAQMAGFDVRIIDPRTGFANPARFPDIDLCAEWPEDALKTRPLDSYTALAVLSHEPGIDDLPLAEALRAGCFYIGALGSRKTHASRIGRLMETGFDAGTLSAIHAPIGLDIGAATPAEIAVAILAQVVQALHARPISFPKDDAGSRVLADALKLPAGGL